MREPRGPFLYVPPGLSPEQRYLARAERDSLSLTSTASHTHGPRKGVRHTQGSSKRRGSLFLLEKVVDSRGAAPCWAQLVFPGLAQFPLGPWKKSSCVASPWCLEPGIHRLTLRILLGGWGRGNSVEPLCSEQSPNLFSSVIDTQIAPEGTCLACLWLC